MPGGPASSLAHSLHIAQVFGGSPPLTQKQKCQEAFTVPEPRQPLASCRLSLGRAPALAQVDGGEQGHECTCLLGLWGGS